MQRFTRHLEQFPYNLIQFWKYYFLFIYIKKWKYGFILFENNECGNLIEYMFTTIIIEEHHILTTLDMFYVVIFKLLIYT